MNDTLDFGPLASLRASDVAFIVLHTQGSPHGTCSTVQAVHRYHRAPPPAGRGWSGIGYHIFIRTDGSIHAGRPLDRIGAHTGGVNGRSWGVCCSGNGDMSDFTDAQKASLVQVIRDLKRRAPHAEVEGHMPLVDRLIGQDRLDPRWRIPKSCPGARVDLREIKTAAALGEWGLPPAEREIHIPKVTPRVVGSPYALRLPRVPIGVDVPDVRAITPARLIQTADEAGVSRGALAQGAAVLFPWLLAAARVQPPVRKRGAPEPMQHVAEVLDELRTEACP